MLELNDNVVFVRGAKKGAIYSFLNGKVYWISEDACELIEKISSQSVAGNCFSGTEMDYITKLEKENLYDPSYKIHEYVPAIEESPALDFVWLEVTQACNCRCLHCYQGNEHIPAQKVLALEEWQDIILQIHQIGVTRVVVIGGEPCTYKYINDILLTLCHFKIHATLFTNATMISDDLFDLIVRNKDYISIKVSLYGPNAEIHDHITQKPGSFKTLADNIRRLTENGVRVDVAVVAMRENQDDLQKTKSVVDALGANCLKYDVIRNVFGGTQDQHTPTNPEVLKNAYFCRPNFKASKTRFDNNCVWNSCWRGKLAITETGDVLPCVFERNIRYGNVKEQSLLNLLHSKLLNQSWKLTFDNISICKDCEFRYACKDCRPLGSSVRGNLTEKNPRCKYDPYTGAWGDIDVNL